jgi:aminoglycoside phosphotransferase (APT) family kinase protein
MGSAAIRAHGAGFAGDLPAPPDPGVPPPARPRLVHGDAVPGNLIATPAGAVVAIDWQCPAAGDPADDLSLFLSPAMQRLYRGAPLSAGERARFLAAYPDRTTVERFLALEPLLAWRIAAHCRWRARRGEADYARVAEAG